MRRGRDLSPCDGELKPMDSRLIDLRYLGGRMLALQQEHNFRRVITSADHSRPALLRPELSFGLTLIVVSLVALFTFSHAEFSNAQFVDATHGPLTSMAQGGGVAWGDFDFDFDLDLYLVNFNSSNRLFRNDSGVFVDVTSNPIRDVGAGGFSVLCECLGCLVCW